MFKFKSQSVFCIKLSIINYQLSRQYAPKPSLKLINPAGRQTGKVRLNSSFSPSGDGGYFVFIFKFSNFQISISSLPIASCLVFVFLCAFVPRCLCAFNAQLPKAIPPQKATAVYPPSQATLFSSLHNNMPESDTPKTPCRA